MASEDKQIHVMFLPYMAPGHMMPMVDIGRLFAMSGLKVTIILTATNARRFQSTIDRTFNSGHQISLEIIHFPSAEVGLPEGCENITSAETQEMTMKLFHGVDILQAEITRLFRERRPSCIVSDSLFPWTTDVAKELGIPRLAFNGSGFFSVCIADSLNRYEPHKSITSETEPFVVPGFPDQVMLTRSQLPDIVKTTTGFSEMFDKIREAEMKSFGFLINSFYELEPAYVDYLRNVVGMQAWHVGPVSLLNGDTDDKADRGDKASVSRHACLNWLGGKDPSSVLYICFGSLVRFTKTQITEIASALEESGHLFIWVVGKVLKTDGNDQEDQGEELWLPVGFEERIKESGQGLIIRGWAPQVLILEHPAMGSFMTHCGWNSLLEGVTAGVPMITWPIFAEQFYNEKLVTQVQKFGVSVGNEVWKIWATQESPLINRDGISRAIKAVMGNSDEAVEKRKRARRLGELAKNAIHEGASSYNDLKSLIEAIRSYKS
ncbi:hypothetical protein SLEP1_g16727 [Rubroshorea leprosula]|uniref:Glycosyltransferase n=1 Tax=Rubroshorea leprosula TaxID=152421 RepID=A0AAV5J3F3_9ROSI|nr:hypothetical protein SLEP1_g16727 [Rubroshorea leprosula]